MYDKILGFSYCQEQKVKNEGYTICHFLCRRVVFEPHEEGDAKEILDVLLNCLKVRVFLIPYWLLQELQP